MRIALRVLRSIAYMFEPPAPAMSQILVSVSRTIGQAQFLHGKNTRHDLRFVAVQQRRKHLQKHFAKPTPKRPKGKRTVI